jgi:hypothetical protein
MKKLLNKVFTTSDLVGVRLMEM